MKFSLRTKLFIALISGLIPLLGESILNPEYLQASTPVQRSIGQQLYEAGNYSSSLEWLHKKLELENSRGDHIAQAAILNNIALVYSELGQWDEANDSIKTGLNLLDTAKVNTNTYPTLLNTRGVLQLQQGHLEDALETLKQAEVLFDNLDDNSGKINSRINQSQVLQKLGFYRRSLILLTDLLSDLEQLNNSHETIASLRSLGIALREVGDYDKAEFTLKKSLKLAQDLESSNAIGQSFIALGNLSARNNNQIKAIEFYDQAIAAKPSPAIILKAQQNQLRSLITIRDWRAVQKQWPYLLQELSARPATSATVEAQLHLASSLDTIRTTRKQSGISTLDIAQLLAQAQVNAQKLGNRKLESVAMGRLGQHYENQQQYQNASKLTQQALDLVNPQISGEISYQWQWQLGRISMSQGKEEDALLFYESAVNTLKGIRQKLVSDESNTQLDFTERVEPLYREYVSLLIQDGNSNPATLEKARQAMESLQLAELDNYFRSACLDTTPVIVDQLDSTAAVIYPIVLPDNLAVIVRLPNQPLKLYVSSVQQEKLEWLTDRLRLTLEQPSGQQYLPLSQELYDVLLRPAMTDIQNSSVETLVFVPDSVLRNIPPAVMHSGERFLIEDYAISLTPGLQLLQTTSRKQKVSQVLVAGLTEAQGGFPALPYAKFEIENIKQRWKHQDFINQDFTQANMTRAITNRRFQILHIATHGNFSSDLDKTYLQAWGERINIDQLSQILKDTESSALNSLDLLVLSACETAVGDRRAILGLAGVASRSGARSTLASLWKVNDQATGVFMNQLYLSLLDNSASKAKTLQIVQNFMLDHTQYSHHPYYWSPFILVGQW